MIARDRGAARNKAQSENRLRSGSEPTFRKSLQYPTISMRNKKLRYVFAALLLVVLSSSSRATAAPAELAPPPAPMNLARPGPATDDPYSPQPLVQGGVVVPLYPPDSPHLNQDRVREAEAYHMYQPPFIGYVVNIHNPSIEFHPAHGSINTGAAVIVAAGGGHKTLNVGGEGAGMVPFFHNQGISTIILRNRLRSDGYDPKKDGVNDAQQAIKLTRAYAEEWGIDPRKIGIMGFSAGAELAAATSLYWTEFDEKNDVPENPLAEISSRPDFIALIYPGPSPFAFGGEAEIPRDAPPAFIASAGWGDWIHAVWATEYFAALLEDGVPNVEMHIYARGHHPGDKVASDEPPATGGVASRGSIGFDKWPDQFLDWFRDLGFLGQPGVETRAAKDVAANLERPDRTAILRRDPARATGTTEKQ